MFMVHMSSSFHVSFSSRTERSVRVAKGSGEGPQDFHLMGPLPHSAAAVSQDYSAVWFHQMQERHWMGTVWP